MLATDAVFSRRPLALDIGKGLGQWDAMSARPVHCTARRLLVTLRLVGAGQIAGATRSVIGEAASCFLEVWNEWHALLRQPGAREFISAERQIPSVPVTVRVFNGCSNALHRGKPWLAGNRKTFSDMKALNGGQSAIRTALTFATGGISSLSRTHSPYSLRATATGRPISTGSLKFQVRTAARNRLMRTSCSKPCRITSHSCRMNESSRARRDYASCRRPSDLPRFRPSVAPWASDEIA
jgi:hypothetical protein